jgi:hypothetical protein
VEKGVFSLIYISYNGSMIKSDLVLYIKKELDVGTSKETLMTSLKAGGWTEQDINDSFLEYEKIKRQTTKPSFSLGMVPVKNTFRNFVRVIFITLIAFLTIAYIIGGEP